MNLNQAIKIAVKSIAAKKSRSFLTMLGIIIGVAAVIVLVSYAQGQNKWLRDYYASMATNTINLEANVWNGKDISDNLYKYCMDLDDLVVGVTPKIQMNNRAIIKYGTKTLDSYNYENWNDCPQVYMGNQLYSLCNAYTISKGRDITYMDVKNYSQVCVLGSHMAELIFNYSNPVGKSITINNKPFEVVGVYESRDPNFMSGDDQIILVPYTLNRVLNGNNSITSFVAKARDSSSTTKAITMLDGFLKGIVGENGYYSVRTPDQWKEESAEQDRMAQLTQAGFAAISLVVGGIGIMNIMLVTVTERTREIGIRKAIGAERRSIVAQFLIEACMLCGIGGLFGVLGGYIVTLLMGRLSFNIILLPNPGVAIGSFFISVALGILFGLYPAIKASGLQPVVALRAE